MPRSMMFRRKMAMFDLGPAPFERGLAPFSAPTPHLEVVNRTVATVTSVWLSSLSRPTLHKGRHPQGPPLPKRSFPFLAIMVHMGFRVHHGLSWVLAVCCSGVETSVG